MRLVSVEAAIDDGPAGPAYINLDAVATVEVGGTAGSKRLTLWMLAPTRGRASGPVCAQQVVVLSPHAEQLEWALRQLATPI